LVLAEDILEVRLQNIFWVLQLQAMLEGQEERRRPMEESSKDIKAKTLH